MAAPFPPAGNQTPHTERPLKVYAEQYLTGQPLPVGATVETGDPPMFSDGVPRVLLATGWRELQLGEWVISSRFSGAVREVLSAEEFAERFGGTEIT